MNIIRKASVILGGLLAIASAHATQSVPGEYVIRAHAMNAQSLRDGLRASGVTVKQVINANENIYLVKSAAGLSALSNNPQVDLVEPNYIYHISTEDQSAEPATMIPQGSKFGMLWGMKNTGQNDGAGQAGKAGADISATKAWAVTTGSRKVVVAIIDTGVDYTHPDLKDNIWTKPGTTDVHGFNATTGALDPMDDHYHGTHCAGTIGGAGANTSGVAGVNWQVSIMGVKFLDKNGSGNLADAIKAIDWARENGANVMSNSWGGGAASQILQEAIQRARDAGIVFVAAAGNDANDNDSAPSYPASYPVDNIISVAASNNQDQLSYFSNFGLKSVDLAAPGEQIYSTVTGGKYKYLSGTSMATPHVSGAVALLLSQEPNLTPQQIKERLNATVDKVPDFADKLVSGGRLNLLKMLKNDRS